MNRLEKETDSKITVDFYQNNTTISCRKELKPRCKGVVDSVLKRFRETVENEVLRFDIPDSQNKAKACLRDGLELFDILSPLEYTKVRFSINENKRLIVPDVLHLLDLDNSKVEFVTCTFNNDAKINSGVIAFINKNDAKNLVRNYQHFSKIRICPCFDHKSEEIFRPYQIKAIISSIISMGACNLTFKSQEDLNSGKQLLKPPITNGDLNCFVNSETHTIFVQNLNPEINEKHLRELFSSNNIFDVQIQFLYTTPDTEVQNFFSGDKLSVKLRKLFEPLIEDCVPSEVKFIVRASKTVPSLIYVYISYPYFQNVNHLIQANNGKIKLRKNRFLLKRTEFSACRLKNDVYEYMNEYIHENLKLLNGTIIPPKDYINHHQNYILRIDPSNIRGEQTFGESDNVLEEILQAFENTLRGEEVPISPHLHELALSSELTNFYNRLQTSYQGKLHIE